MADTLPFSMQQVLSLVGAECIKGSQTAWADFKCPVNPKHEIRVNTEENVWTCFHQCSRCPMSADENHGGMLDLYCLYKGTATRKDALKEILDALYGGIYNPAKAKAIEPTKPKHQVQDLAPIDNRDKAYRALLAVCILSKQHKKDLQKRGLTEQNIAEGLYRSVPQTGLTQIAAALQRKGVSLEGIPGFYFEKRSKKYKMLSHSPGYFIPYFDENGKIQGLQIRNDVEITPSMSEDEIRAAKKKRYRWFTSSWVRNGKVGAGSLNWAFFGRPGTLKKTEGSDEFAVYVTEGGLKANVASVLLERCYGEARPVVAIPGVSCYTTFEKLCDTLHEKGVSVLVDAFDADRETNENVANSIKRMGQIAEAHGMKFVPWKWENKYKGVDDFLLAKATFKAKKIRKANTAAMPQEE